MRTVSASVATDGPEMEGRDLNEAAPVQEKTRKPRLNPARQAADPLSRHLLDSFLGDNWGAAAKWSRRMGVDHAIVDHFCREGFAAVTLRDLLVMEEEDRLAFFESLVTYLRGARKGLARRPSLEELDRKAHIASGQLAQAIDAALEDGHVSPNEARRVEERAEALVEAARGVIGAVRLKKVS